jgi:hypothetical protein
MHQSAQNSHVTAPRWDLQATKTLGFLSLGKFDQNTLSLLNPPLSVRSTQPIEPHSSHLLIPAIVWVQRIAKIRCRIESAERIHHADFLASIGSRVDNPYNDR